MPPSPRAVRPISRDEPVLVPKGPQCAQVWVGRDHDTPAVTSITPIRTAQRHKFLPAAADRTITSCTSDNSYRGFINHIFEYSSNSIYTCGLGGKSVWDALYRRWSTNNGCDWFVDYRGQIVEGRQLGRSTRGLPTGIAGFPQDEASYPQRMLAQARDS